MRALLLVCAAVSACGYPVPQTCTDRRAGGPFCVPDGGAARSELKLQLRDRCASPCDKGVVGCQVTVDGGTITLELVGQSCFEKGAICTDNCVIPNYGCSPPALADGTYTVVSPGESPQLMTVTSTGASRCVLP